MKPFKNKTLGSVVLTSISYSYTQKNVLFKTHYYVSYFKEFNSLEHVKGLERLKCEVIKLVT